MPDEPNTTYFQLLGHEHHISCVEFTLYMGLYDHEYTTTGEYQHHHFFPCLGECDNHHWRRLSTDSSNFTPNASKASSLQSLTLLFVHTLLSGTVTGRSGNTGTITRQELYYLLSMADNYPYHLGFVLTMSFHHQATNP